MLDKYGIKFVLVIISLIVAIITGILISLALTTSHFVTDTIETKSKSAMTTFQKSVELLKISALHRAQMIAGIHEIADAVIKRNKAEMLEIIEELGIDMDFIAICDVNGNVIARSHSDEQGDNLMYQESVRIPLTTGQGVADMEEGTTVALSTRGSAAIKTRNGKIVGVVTCGQDLSHTEHVDLIKEESGCDITFFAGDTRISSTIIDNEGNRVIGTKASDSVIEKVLKNKEDLESRINLFGKIYNAIYSPIVVNDKAIGMYFAGLHIDSTIMQERIMMALIVFSIVLLCCVIFITAVVIKYTVNKKVWYENILDCIPFPLSITDMKRNWTFINKPVEDFLGVNRASVLGKQCSNWGAGICLTENCGINRLECGQNQTFFNQQGMDFEVISSYLTNTKGKKVGHIEIVEDMTELFAKQRAEKELMEKLNRDNEARQELAQEINKLSASFVEKSDNIVESAKVLADNSVKQTSNVGNLHGSISEIAQKTKANTNNANKAAELANKIKEDALKGSEQMGKLTKAVEEINESTQAISKVIQLIEDIASQTDILALNAAIEAARAGDSGRGFAIVADEVSKLASQSTSSVKETNSFIKKSIEKSVLGVDIAKETALALQEIVSGIQINSQLTKEIVDGSEEQNKSIDIINVGIAEILESVQQNSATAEEFSAESEAINSDSMTLKQLMNNFNNA